MALRLTGTSLAPEAPRARPAGSGAAELAAQAAAALAARDLQRYGALFQAAQRLDPALPHVRRNLAELSRRRRGVSDRDLRLRAVKSGLAALARRAKRVAAQAKPAEGLKLSLCMIVRDEEEMLPRCLAAVAPAVDEIVVVDTGSQDRTIEIARSFGARVLQREWTASFP